MENVTQRSESGLLFSKTWALFSIFKKGQQGIPPSLWLNTQQYPRISLNILQNFWINYSGYVSVLNMADTCSTVFEDVSGLTEFWICLNMAQYVPIAPEYASICMIIAKYCWMSLNMSENVWINCFDYARVLNMSHRPRYLAGFWICLRFKICQGSENATL